MDFYLHCRRIASELNSADPLSWVFEHLFLPEFPLFLKLFLELLLGFILFKCSWLWRDKVLWERWGERVSAENTDAIHLNFKGKPYRQKKKSSENEKSLKSSVTFITNVHVGHSNVIRLLEDIPGLAAGFQSNISRLRHPLLLLILPSTSTSRPKCQNRFWVEITVVSL